MTKTKTRIYLLLIKLMKEKDELKRHTIISIIAELIDKL